MSQTVKLVITLDKQQAVAGLRSLRQETDKAFTGIVAQSKQVNSGLGRVEFRPAGIVSGAVAAEGSLKALGTQIAAVSAALRDLSALKIGPVNPIGGGLKGQAGSDIQAVRANVEEQKRLEANKFRFLFQQQQIDVASYKGFLDKRLQEDRAYTSGWMTLARQRHSIDAADTRAAAKADAERSKSLARTAGKLPGMGVAGDLLGNGILGASGAAAVGFGAAVRAASDFDAAMTKVANNTTMTDADLAHMKETVVSLGKESGADFNDLADGFMHVANFGYKGADAVNILREAMKSAVATGSQVGATADVLAKAMHEFGMRTEDAGKAMNVMHLAANEGNMTLEQFDQSAGPALGIAANLGIKFTEAAAAISSLTRHGYDAAEAVTQIKSVMEHMVVPTGHVHQELERLSKATGVDLVRDFTAAGLKSRGLYGIFQDLTKATKGHEEEIYKLIPALRGGQGAMALAGTGAQDYRDILNDLDGAMSGKLDPTTQGYNRTLETAANKSKRVKQEFNALAIKIGDDLLPALHSLLDDGDKVLKWFNDLPTVTQKGLIRLTEIATVTGLIAGNLLKWQALAKGAGLMGGGAEAGAGAVAGGGLLGLLGRGVGGGGFGGYLKSMIGGNPLARPLGGYGLAGSLGGQLLGGGVLALPALAGGWGLSAINSENMAASDETGRGLGTADLSVYINRMAALRKAHPDSYSTLPEYQAADNAYRQMGGANQRSGVGLEAGSAVGDKIAQEAWKKQLDGSARTFQHQCEGLAHATYDSVTKAYTKVLDNSGGSALTALGKFKALGLAKPYTPGMALPPGSLLYSQTMGNGSGHVQTIGPGGQRLDQYGINHFNPRNFQYYVPPPGIGGGGTGGNGGPEPLTQDQIDAQSDLKKRLYEATHSEYQNRRYEAYRTFKDDKETDPAKAKQLLLATLKQIDKDEADEQKKHHEETERQQKEHLARLQARQKEYWAGVIAGRRKAEAAGATASEARAEVGDHLASLADPDAAGFDQERAAARKRLRERVRSFGGDPGLSNDQLQRMPYSPQTLKDFQGAQDELTGSLDDIGRRQGQKGKDQAAQDAAEVADFQRQATQQQADLNREVWQHAGGDMSAYFKSLRDEADAALAEVKAKYGVGSKNPNAAAVAAAQGVRDARYAVIGQQAVDDARSAQEKIDQAQAESVRFEYEQHIIGLAQYQDYLRRKLALTRQYETADDRKNGVLSRDWMQVKGDLDASLGEGRAKPSRAQAVGGDSFWGGMADGAAEAGSRALDSFLHPKDRKSVFKNFWSDLGTMAEDGLKGSLKAVLRNLLTGQGGGSGGGGLLGGLLGGILGGRKPAASPLGGGSGLGAVGRLSPAAFPGGSALTLPGLGTDPGMGGAGGGSSPLGMLGMLGKGGIGGLFSHGGLFNTSGALGGFGAALPWIGGGLMLNSMLGNPLGKALKGLRKIFHFAGGGLVPGHGSGDTVPAMLTPGEFVVPKAVVAQAFMPRISLPNFAPGYAGGAGVSPSGSVGPASARGAGDSFVFNDYGDKHLHTEMDMERYTERVAKKMQVKRRAGIPAS